MQRCLLRRFGLFLGQRRVIDVAFGNREVPAFGNVLVRVPMRTRRDPLFEIGVGDVGAAKADGIALKTFIPDSTWRDKPRKRNLHFLELDDLNKPVATKVEKAILPDGNSTYTEKGSICL